MRYAALLPGCTALILAGCTNHLSTHIGSTPTLVTDADVRVITERPSPFDPANPARRTVCTEPSPDVAKALATALTVAGSASVPSGPSGSVTVNNQTAEGILPLTNRLPTVQALRDIGYRLCEAWANGAVGESAYALGLGRYGELLVTLMLGEDMVASSRPAPGPLTVQLAQGAGATTPPATDKPAKTSQQSPATAPTQVARDTLDDPAKSVQLAMLGPMLATATDASHGTVPPAVKTTPSGSATKPGAITPATDAGATSLEGSLLALQKNYLTLGGMGPLMVACIAAFDTTTPVAVSATRTAATASGSNNLLTFDVCQSVVRGVAGTVAQKLAASRTGKPSR